MLQNPELIRTILLNNPQMREVIERNPEVGHILNDPQILRQTLEMYRNPELYREMMRNTDRAMSNIENHPEGFNLLRRMYTNVQEPMMDATTGVGQQNPFPNLFGNTQTPNSNTTSNTDSTPQPTNVPLPNPWVPPVVNTSPASTNPGSNLTPPNLFGQVSGTPDFNLLSSTLQDPSLQNLMMQQVLSNPAMMQEIIGTNPMLQQMMNTNPQLRQMMSNPDFMRQLLNPQSIQAMMQMQSAIQQLQTQGIIPGVLPGEGSSGLGTPGGMGGFGGLAGLGETGGLDLNSLFGIPQTQTQTQTNQEPPEVRFQTQLQQLNSMGFSENQQNIALLLQANGDINVVVDRLLNRSNH